MFYWLRILVTRVLGREMPLRMGTDEDCESTRAPRNLARSLGAAFRAEATPTQQECEDVSGCGWEKGQWSECGAREPHARLRPRRTEVLAGFAR